MLCVCPQFYIWFLTRRIDYILILLQWKKYSKKSLAIKLKNANPDSNPTGSGSVFSLDQVNLIIANTDPNVKKKHMNRRDPDCGTPSSCYCGPRRQPPVWPASSSEYPALWPALCCQTSHRQTSATKCLTVIKLTKCYVG